MLECVVLSACFKFFFGRRGKRGRPNMFLFFRPSSGITSQNNVLYFIHGILYFWQIIFIFVVQYCTFAHSYMLLHCFVTCCFYLHTVLSVKEKQEKEKTKNKRSERESWKKFAKETWKQEVKLSPTPFVPARLLPCSSWLTRALFRASSPFVVHNLSVQIWFPIWCT